MKKIIYILLVIVFFNCCFLSLYYLKIFNVLGLDKLLMLNISVFIISVIYSFVHSLFFIHKFNYYLNILVGLLIGSIYTLFIKNMILEEYLFLITYMSFLTTFISYSIYFEKKKDSVFK